jgi:hypothetical protein
MALLKASAFSLLITHRHADDLSGSALRFQTHS